MKESLSILRRIARIKKLAHEYYILERGVLIDRYRELLRIADIQGPECATHPHKNHRVYISRQAIKHFVEERKDAFRVRHSERETLEAIDFALSMILDTLIDFDRHEYEPKEKPPKHFYSKDYSPLDRPMLRILVEQRDHILEIHSIHFRKRKEGNENAP